MGQYYDAVLQDKDGEQFSTSRIGNLKLMEHAWFGDNLMNKVEYKLYHNPMRVLWLGDYADDDVIKSVTAGKPQVKPVDESHEIFAINNTFSVAGKFLVNHDKKQYINIDRYYEKNAYPVWREQLDCIHPLPILTNISNGEGGGDYFGVNMELAGSWAWDVIEITDNAPNGYAEALFTFNEKSS